MAEENKTQTDTRRFLTAAANQLHEAFIAASRVQSKRSFARIHGGAVLDLRRMRLEDGSMLAFRVALDCSEYRGRIGYTPFRKALTVLLGRLAERIRLRADVATYTNQETGAVLFWVPGVIQEEGRTNVLLLGFEQPEAGVAILRLQFVDPEQFRKREA